LEERLTWLRGKDFEYKNLDLIIQLLKSPTVSKIDPDPEDPAHDQLSDDESSSGTQETNIIPIEIKWDWDINVWETIRTKAEGTNPRVAGCLNQIIQDLTIDSKYVQSFIVTHKSFALSTIVFKKLRERFFAPEHLEEEIKTNIQVTVVFIILTWLDLEPNHWANSYLSTALSEFLDELVTRGRWPTLVGKLQTAIQNMNTKVEILFSWQEQARIKDIPPVIRPKRPHLSKTDVRKSSSVKIPTEIEPNVLQEILTIDDPKIIAEQINVTDWCLFSSINSVEFLDLAWQQSEIGERSHNLRRMIKISSFRSTWVSKVVLLQKNTKSRALAYDKLVYVAEHLLKLSNFNSCAAILLGLRDNSVRRCLCVMSCVTPEAIELEKQLCKMIDPSSSFHTYHTMIKDRFGAVLPWLKIYLGGLEKLIDSHLPNTLSRPGGHVINFEKYEAIADYLNVFQSYRSNFDQIRTKPDPVIQKLIQVETVSKKGETLKEISYRVEQVGRHTTDEEVS